MHQILPGDTLAASEGIARGDKAPRLASRSYTQEIQTTRHRRAERLRSEFTEDLSRGMLINSIGSSYTLRELNLGDGA